MLGLRQLFKFSYGFRTLKGRALDRFGIENTHIYRNLRYFFKFKKTVLPN